MQLEMLRAAVWSDLSDKDRVALATGLASNLPTGFVFQGLATGLGSGGAVARFAYDGAEFSLVPGATNLMLGYDPDRLTLRDDDLAVLTEEHGDADEARNVFAVFKEQLTVETTMRRSVNVEPFLVERVARDVCVTLLPPGHSAYSELSTHPVYSELSTLDRRHDFVGTLAGVRVEVHWTDREPEVRERRPMLAEEVEKEIAGPGFRLPTEDEWEYACNAGRDTFFKWGNFFPLRFWPPGNDDTPVAEMPPFSQAAQPNDLGLTIAYDPYRWEFCRTRGVLKGGDGGSCWCGGEGTLAIWRALATPFRAEVRPHNAGIINPFTGKALNNDGWRPVATARARRILPLK
jgi:hypothetical protein